MDTDSTYGWSEHTDLNNGTITSKMTEYHPVARLAFVCMEVAAIKSELAKDSGKYLPLFVIFELSFQDEVSPH